jgi:beta-N-acetylhexosaminidase
MIEITGLLPDATPECIERLDRAMATTGADEPDTDFSELVAKRDELLALI